MYVCVCVFCVCHSPSLPHLLLPSCITSLFLPSRKGVHYIEFGAGGDPWQLARTHCIYIYNNFEAGERSWKLPSIFLHRSYVVHFHIQSMDILRKRQYTGNVHSPTLPLDFRSRMVALRDAASCPPPHPRSPYTLSPRPWFILHRFSLQPHPMNPYVRWFAGWDAEGQCEPAHRRASAHG